MPALSGNYIKLVTLLCLGDRDFFLNLSVDSNPSLILIRDQLHKMNCFKVMQGKQLI